MRQVKNKSVVVLITKIYQYDTQVPLKLLKHQDLEVIKAWQVGRVDRGLSGSFRVCQDLLHGPTLGVKHILQCCDFVIVLQPVLYLCFVLMLRTSYMMM